MKREFVLWLVLLLLVACDQVDNPVNSDSPSPTLQLQSLLWPIETVDPDAAASGLFTSLALDADGHPHISYRDPDGVNYAHFNGTEWLISTLDSAGSNSSLVVDGSAGLHVAFDTAVYPTDSLRYAYNDGTGWVIGTVESGGRLGEPSLAVDSSGHPHISYYRSGVLGYAHHDGTAWVIETVDAVGHSGFVSSIAIDSSGNPHISFRGDAQLKYAHFDGTSWFVESLETLGPGDLDSSLALDSSDRPHITYKSFDHFKYIHFDGVWLAEVIDDGGEGNLYPSLILDGSDRPHVSYDLGLNLKYAHRSASGWQLDTVDSGIGARHTSLALDSGGRPHISYADELSADLKYAVGLLDSDGDGIPDGSDPDTIGDVVAALPNSAFKPVTSGPGHKTSMLSILADIEQNIADGNTDEALAQLRDLRRHVDGCPGTPRTGESADKNDWIVDCDAQREVRALIDLLIRNLSS